MLAAGDVANEEIKAKVLCLHGHNDPMVSAEQVLAFETEMAGAGVDWQSHAQVQTLHAFTNSRTNNPKFGAQVQ